jgi:hypothetical protein
MDVKNLSEEYRKVWTEALPFLKQGRPGDDEHAAVVVDTVMSYRGNLRFDESILIPVAMLHDIGHAAILSEHFKFITGTERLENGKLVHMLAGAKIAQDILAKVRYDPEKSKEIVEIVSMHDADQLKGVDIEAAYDTDHKRIFHDIDSLDRFNDSRFVSLKGLATDQNKIRAMLEKSLEAFFFDEFRQVAERYMANSNNPILKEQADSEAMPQDVIKNK